MDQQIWINGKTLAFADARIGVEERGFQFADGVYELMRIYNRKPFAPRQHLARLWTSAEGIRLAVPYEQGALEEEIRSFITKSGSLRQVDFLCMGEQAQATYITQIALKSIFSTCRLTIGGRVRTSPTLGYIL